MKRDRRAKVGRAFSSAAVELALANYPGFFATTTPGAAQSYRRVLAGPRSGGGSRPAWSCSLTAGGSDRSAAAADGEPGRADGRRADRPSRPAIAPGQPLGRSSPPARATRAAMPTSASGPATTPATPGCAANLDRRSHRRAAPGGRAAWRSSRYELPNLRAAQLRHRRLPRRTAWQRQRRFDPQAKGLGEYLRSRPCDAGDWALSGLDVWVSEDVSRRTFVLTQTVEPATRGVWVSEDVSRRRLSSHRRGGGRSQVGFRRAGGSRCRGR